MQRWFGQNPTETGIGTETACCCSAYRNLLRSPLAALFPRLQQ